MDGAGSAMREALTEGLCLIANAVPDPIGFLSTRKAVLLELLARSAVALAAASDGDLRRQLIEQEFDEAYEAALQRVSNETDE